MRFFLTGLGSEGGGVTPPTPIPPPSITSPVVKVTGREGNLTQPSFLFFTLYKSSEWPELTGLTRDYFWLSSSHHQTGYNSYWINVDSPSLDVFEQVGGLFVGYTSPETPKLYRTALEDIPDTEVLNVTFHPSNLPQRTNLFTTSSGSLQRLSENWTNRGEVLINDPTVPVNEEHTGYAVPRKVGPGVYEMKSLYDGDFVAGQEFAYWRSPDGRNWTIQELTTKITINNQVYSHTRISDHFIIGGEIFATAGLRNLEEEVPDGGRVMVMLKYDSNYRNPVLWSYLGYLGDTCQHYYEGGDTLHIYMIDARFQIPGRIWYSTLDISNINNWIQVDSSQPVPDMPLLIDM